MLKTILYSYAMENASWANYLSIILVVLFALALSLSILVLNQIFGQKARETAPNKKNIYECGVPFEGDARQQFSVRYYLVGIIFLLFDVEVALMYPWARVYQEFLPQGWTIIIEVLIFVLILLAGYVYLRLRKALDWDES